MFICDSCFQTVNKKTSKPLFVPAQYLVSSNKTTTPIAACKNEQHLGQAVVNAMKGESHIQIIVSLCLPKEMQ